MRASSTASLLLAAALVVACNPRAQITPPPEAGTPPSAGPPANSLDKSTAADAGPDDATCPGAPWVTETIGTAGAPGGEPVLALDAEARVHVAYRGTDGDIWYTN